MTQSMITDLSRRRFIQSSAAGMAAVLAGKNVMFAAQPKRKFRVALIGCGNQSRVDLPAIMGYDDVQS